MLTVKQQSAILTTIDELCEDNWCQGDYDFNFLQFHCDKDNHSCRLDLQLKYIIWDNDYQTPVFESTYRAHCDFTPIYSINDIIFNNNFYSHPSPTLELTDTFYQQLDDCIERSEQEASELITQKLNSTKILF